MAAGTAARGRTLEEAPPWALAVVCAVFVIISVLIEHGIHSVGKWFQKRRKKAMSEAMEKIKAELMLLGFISLLLTVGTRFIAKIFILAELEDTMLPCKPYHEYKKNDTYADDDEGDIFEAILWFGVKGGLCHYTSWIYKCTTTKPAFCHG